jgi:hypothetical protein
VSISVMPVDHPRDPNNPQPLDRVGGQCTRQIYVMSRVSDNLSQNKKERDSAFIRARSLLCLTLRLTTELRWYSGFVKHCARPGRARPSVIRQIFGLHPLKQDRESIPCGLEAGGPHGAR